MRGLGMLIELSKSMKWIELEIQELRTKNRKRL